jgi:NitT/TauT family transport system substrate-binding protein
MIRRFATPIAAIGLLCAMLMGAATPAAAQSKTLVVAVPGVPPIFAAVIAYVAEKEGFFKKHGVDVTIRPFDNGTAAARAVIAGDIDMALSPTPPVINQASNSGAQFVAVYGMPSPDWVIGSTEAGKTCNDIIGKPIGVDSIGGARSVALRSMLAGCPGVKMEQVQQVALGSNTAPAMIAGQLQFGVLHLDDLAVMQVQGKTVHTLLAMKTTNPTSHYLIWVVRKDKLAANRDAVVRAVAGLIEAARYMNDPKNADTVADIATVTGHKKDVAKTALKEFLAIDFWAAKDDGMDKANINAVSALMKKIGSVNADKEAVTYDQLVDPSVWKDANAMVK